MNQDNLNQLTGELVNLLRSGEKFVGEQAPEVFREVLRYAIVTSLGGILVGALCLALAWRIHKFIQLKLSENQRSEWGVAYVGVGILCIGGLVLCLCGCDELIKAWLAPKAYLISYFMQHHGCS